MQLKMSDVFWCLSDTGWILAALGSLLEPWTAGSTVFAHHLPQFDPKVIIEVRRLTFQHQQTPKRKSFQAQKFDPTEKYFI